jgi:hypothetical protein
VGRSFLVRIKPEVLQTDLSAVCGAAYARADIRQWLLGAGFERAGA